MQSQSPVSFGELVDSLLKKYNKKIKAAQKHQ
jgi:hypothetical protein